MRAVHNINIPYIVRFIWASSGAQMVWEPKITQARNYIINRLPSLLVESGLAKFAPTTKIEEMSDILGNAVIANHYGTRWSTDEMAMKSNPQLVNLVGTIGTIDKSQFKFDGRWDLIRDIYQLALAPECCKKAYFESSYHDPYHNHYDNVKGKIKKIPSVSNSLHSPFGLYLSPIVPCKPDCEHAHAKSLEVAELIKLDNKEVYSTLKLVVEMPLRIDSYRGMACVDTPMFKGVFATDAYKDKYILDFRPINPELFSYSQEWVAKGSRFPFKGQFSELFGG